MLLGSVEIIKKNGAATAAMRALLKKTETRSPKATTESAKAFSLEAKVALIVYQRSDIFADIPRSPTMRTRIRWILYFYFIFLIPERDRGIMVRET